MALFFPLEVLYGTRFGSKHHMMVPLAQVSKVGITDPFPDLWSPPQGLPKGQYISKYSPFEAPISPVFGLLALEKVIRWPQVTRFSQECPIWVVTTSKMQFGLYTWHFVTFYGSKRALFAHKMALWGPLEGLQRSGNGSVMPTLLA